MNQEHISQTIFDQMVGNDQSQFYKAIIPFLPPKSRQILAIYLKTFELKNTLSLFSNPENQIEICNLPAQDPIDILNDIQTYCYGSTKEQLDQLINMIALVKMMQIINEPVCKEDTYESGLEK